MVKQITPAIAAVLFLSSCTAFKALQFTNNKQAVVTPAAEQPAKFINTISVTADAAPEKTVVRTEPVKIHTAGPKADEIVAPKEEPVTQSDIFTKRNANADVETASPVQLKYAVLMKTDVEALPNKTLLEAVDEWYGVRYRTGGNTKSGVDCSGFTCAVYAAAYGFSLPRVSKEQYRLSRKISTTELQEGDLLFFHTRGSGVSHVGVYLGNNKFIHATVHGGVMVNDLFEPYYLQKFLGAGRYDDKQIVSSN
jgi:lipoprotein Spr